MKLIFLCGLLGVGKLTVARELGALTSFKIFHNHLAVDLLASVFEFGSPPFIDLREMIWLALFSRAAEAKFPGLIFTFAFDRTVRSDFIENTRQAVESHGGEVLFVELQCAPEELERRITQPSRQGFGKLLSVERVHELRAAGAFVDSVMRAEGLLLDTTELSASETARLIFDKLGLR